MAHDARVSSALINHPKTKKLRRRLGPAACWSLVALFAYASEHHWDGNLSGMTDEDIAIAGDWDSDPQGFCQALHDVAFFDGDSGGYSIHDWADHQPYAAARGVRSESARKAVSKRWEYERNTERKDSGNTEGIRPEYAGDTPNQSKPNQSKPVRATRFPANFSLTKELADYASAKGLIDPPKQFEKFKGNHLAKGSKFLDWTLAWYNWVRYGVEFQSARASPVNGDFQPAKKLNPVLYQDQ
jgi:hypothetical protein